MKRLNKTLITLTISALFISACSNDDAKTNSSDGTTSDPKTEIESFEGDDNRFIEYNSIKAPNNVTKASKSVPTAPAIPEGTVNMMDVDGKGTKYTPWNAKKGTNYYLPKDVEWRDQIQFNDGINYYVEGSLTLNFYGTKGELIILPHGTLRINDSTSSINNINIRNWGEFDVDPNANLTIGLGASLVSYSKSEIKAAKIVNQGVFEHYGDVTLAADLDNSGANSSFTLHGSLTAGSIKCGNSSKSYISGNVVTKTGVEVNGNASLKVGASMVVEDGDVYSTNNSTIDVADYMKCNTLKLDSNGKVITHKETLIVCDNLVYNNNTAKIHNDDYEGTYTVIVVKNLEEAWDSIDRMNGGGIDLHTDPEEYEDLDWTSNVIFNGPTYIPEKGLRPEFGTNPTNPDPVYTLIHIGKIESLDKETVSATSIDFINNLAYFSWHKRGKEYEGYIDVADVPNRSILSTLQSPTQDFNNISVVGDQICAVGSNSKGAVVSIINYSNNEVSAESSRVEGASANSILKAGQSHWITTNRGVTILPDSTFIELRKSKCVISHNEKVVVLAGTPDASIYIFEQNGELIKSFSCGTISEADGKNSILSDGDILYVSLGKDGMRSYDLDGNLLNEFTGLVDAVNNVSVDEKYIYMACGVDGLYILDKKDFSLKKRFKLSEVSNDVVIRASANFVKKASDGLIYVAYGLNGVHIFELRVEL